MYWKIKAYLDSNSEDSDSELSGKEIDSDIENEKQIVYDREVYKDDLTVNFIHIKLELNRNENFYIKGIKTQSKRRNKESWSRASL